MACRRGRHLLPVLLLAPTYAIFVYSYQSSLALLPAPLVIIILFTHPILVSLWQGLRGHERLGWLQWGANILALGGIVVAASDIGFAMNIEGIILAAFASILCAGTILLSSWGFSKGSVPAHSQAGLGFAMFLLLPFMAFDLVSGDGISVLPSGLNAWSGVFLSAFSIGSGLVLFLLAMRRIGASRAALISNLEPVIGFSLAWAIADADLTPNLVIGSLMVIAAVMDWRFLMRRKACSAIAQE